MSWARRTVNGFLRHCLGVPRILVDGRKKWGASAQLSAAVITVRDGQVPIAGSRNRRSMRPVEGEAEKCGSDATAESEDTMSFRGRVL